ncbi:MAG TPA: DUF1634 domain-containing protein [Terriglobales bacterium]|nr:DUF1634 domain-containing protein [Terriglobales bacterium]
MISDFRQAWNDQKIEILIGNLLRIGVIISAALVFCGAVIYLGRHGMELTNYNAFRGEPSGYRTFSGIIGQVLHSRGRGIIQLGLVLLIATPVVRVAFSIWGFLAERDRMYAAFTTLVLIILLYSLVGSS